MTRGARIAIIAVVAACAVALVGWLLLAQSGNLPQRDLRRALELPPRGPRKANEAAEKHAPGPPLRPSETPH